MLNVSTRYLITMNNDAPIKRPIQKISKAISAPREVRNIMDFGIVSY